MYLLKEFFFVNIIIKIAFANLLEIDNGQSNRHKSLILCIEQIANKYFEHKNIITVLESRIKSSTKNKFFNILIGNIFWKMKWTLILKTSKINETIHQENYKIKGIHIYIIHLSNVNDLIRAISLLQDKSWNPHAKFIVFSTEVFPKISQDLEYLVTEFWKLKVLNVIFLLPKFDTNIFNIYTWFPFSDGNCGNNFTTTKIINECTNGNFMNNNNKIFENKIPKNLNKCSIKVRTVIWPPYVFPPKEQISNSRNNINFTHGLEIVLLNHIAQIANFSVVYSVSNKSLDWGALNYMGETRGLFKTLLNEEVDMGISSLAATPIRYMNLDPSIPYTSESMTWCVPKANFKPEWLNIYQTFALYTWLLIFAAYFTISCFFFTLSYKRDLTIFQTVQESFLNTFSVLVGVSVWKKPNHFIIRVIFMLWAIFSLHFVALFESNLIRFIVNPALEKQITRFDELINHNIPMGSFYIWREYFNNTDAMNSLELKMNQKWVDCHDIDMCLSHVAYVKNYSIAIPRLYISYSMKKSVIYSFSNDYISFPVQMYAYRGFPFIHRINNIIGIIFQSGFLSKWEQDLKNCVRTTKESSSIEIINKNDNSDNNPDILSLKALQGVFIIYLIGIVSSIFIFIIELILFCYTSYIFAK